MVCESCQKKLKTIVTPDTWKEGSRNAKTGSGGRMVNENKLGKAAAQKTQPYSKQCRICNTSLHQQANYCTNCAYKKGICTMCGKKIMDTSSYKQSIK